jgi:hypothetical protein
MEEYMGSLIKLSESEVASSVLFGDWKKTTVKLIWNDGLKLPGYHNTHTKEY